MLLGPMTFDDRNERKQSDWTYLPAPVASAIPDDRGRLA